MAKRVAEDSRHAPISPGANKMTDPSSAAGRNTLQTRVARLQSGEIGRFYLEAPGHDH